MQILKPIKYMSEKKIRKDYFAFMLGDITFYNAVFFVSLFKKYIFILLFIL